MNTAAMAPDQSTPYQQPIGEVLAAFGANAPRGLNKEEVRARLQKYGKNELTAEKPVPAWKKFLAQFQDVLVILLLIATVISTVLWLYERESALPYEAMAIFAVVLLNAIMATFSNHAPRKRSQRCARCRRRMPTSSATASGRTFQRSSLFPATSFSLKRATPSRLTRN